MLIIFVGALGGFAISGFIGLFTGAIVLALVYELLPEWLAERADAGEAIAALRPELVDRLDEQVEQPAEP